MSCFFPRSSGQVSLLHLKQEYRDCGDSGPVKSTKQGGLIASLTNSEVSDAVHGILHIIIRKACLGKGFI